MGDTLGELAFGLGIVALALGPLGLLVRGRASGLYFILLPPVAILIGTLHYVVPLSRLARGWATGVSLVLAVTSVGLGISSLLRLSRTPRT